MSAAQSVLKIFVADLDGHALELPDLGSAA